METPKEFRYRSRLSLDDFLRENPLWNELYYGLYLNIKAHVHVYDNVSGTFRGLEIPAVDMLNEVAYQCLRVVTEPHPEDCFERRFLDAPLRNNPLFTEAQERDMCFALVYVVLKSCDRSDDLDCTPFLKSYERKMFWYNPIITSENVSYANSFIEDAVNYLKQNTKRYKINLFTGPEKPEVLVDKSAEWWWKITANFDEIEIRYIVSYWRSDFERAAILKIIYHAYRKCIEQGIYIKKIDFVQIHKDIFEEAKVYEDEKLCIDPLLDPVFEKNEEELYLYPITDLMEIPSNDEGTILKGDTDVLPQPAVSPKKDAMPLVKTKGRGAKKKILFGNEQDTHKWAELFVQYLKSHHKSNIMIDSTGNNFVTRALLSFLREWQKHGIVNKNSICGPACARFLQDKCNLSFDVKQKAYEDHITKILNGKAKQPSYIDDVQKFVSQHTAATNT